MPNIVNQLPRITKSCANYLRVKRLTKTTADFIGSFFSTSCYLCKQPTGQLTCPSCQRSIEENISIRMSRLKISASIAIPIYSLSLYEGFIKQLLNQFKFHKDPLAGKILTSVFKHGFSQIHTLNDIDTIIAVPIHRWRYLYRGFNQSYILARSLANKKQRRISHCLYRRHYTPPQVRSTLIARKTQLIDVMAQKKPIKSQHLLIVDDVITTGSTARSVLLTLINNPDNHIDKISVLLLCRAR
ncbi:MAG: ComF family protein [Francisellaceae bacterium]